MDTDRSRDSSNPFISCLSRRAALGRLAGGGLAVALLTAVGLDNTQAKVQATPEPQRAEGGEANRFVLAGEGTQITYDATAKQLTYEGPSYRSRTFSGDEVREVRAEESQLFFGRLVTVRLARIPAYTDEWLTLLLPTAGRTFSTDGGSIRIATLAILTTHWQGHAGCDPGPCVGNSLRAGHEVVMLTGTAEVVVP